MRYIRMMALENALAEGNMISNIALTHLLDRPTGPMWIGPSIRSLERMELKMIENILSLKDVLVGIDVEYSHLRPLNLVVWSMHLEITDLVNERRKILALLEECMMVFEKRKVPNAAPYFGDIPGRPSAGKEETSEMAADDKNFIERSLAELRSGVKKHSEIPVLIPVMPAGDPESRPSFIPIFAVPSVIDRDDRRENFRAILPDEPEDVAGSRGKKDAPTIHSPMKVDGIIGGEAMTGDEYNIEGNMDAQRRSRLQSSMPSITGAMGAVGLLAAASRLMSPSGKEEMHPEEGLGAPVFFGMENEEKQASILLQVEAWKTHSPHYPAPCPC